MVKNLKLNNKLTLALIIAFSSSCSVNNLANISEPKKADIIKLSSNETKVDFKNTFGKETNISLKVNINTNSFNIKLDAVSPGRKVDINSYNVWICTDATQPISTAVTPTNTRIYRDGSNVSTQHSFTFVNIPATNPASNVTYYAVAQALDVHDNILTENNNASSIPLYVGDDVNSPVSVSSNSIDINSNNVITSSNNTFTINMILKSSKPASNNFTLPIFSASSKDISTNVNDDGNGFIVWSEKGESGTYIIFAQRIKGFNPVGDIFNVNHTSIDDCDLPSISINSSGNGVIVWRSLEGAYTQIRMTKILNYDIQMSSDNLVLSNNSNQSMPHVKINENGDGLVVWQDDRNSKWDIYGVKISNLSIGGSNFKVNQDASLDDTINPKVYVEDNGYGIVAWTRGNHIYSMPIGTFSTLLTFDQQLIFGDTSNAKSDIYAKSDGTGIVVADNNDKKISGRFLNSFQPTASSFVVSDNIVSNKKNPSIVVKSSGNGLIVWDDDRESSSLPTIWSRKIVSSTLASFDLNMNDEYDPTKSWHNPKVIINNSGHGFVISQGVDQSSHSAVNIRHIINYEGFQGINVSTLSGSTSGSANGNITEALFTSPEYMAKDSLGNIYVSEPSSHRVRKIDTLGNVSTFAGTGASGFSGDLSPATNANLNEPSGIAVDSSDNVYIADTNNNRIRKVDTSGIITTHVGSSILTGSIDGSSTSYSLLAPKDLDIDSSGNIYFSEVGSSNLIRKYSSGTVSTIVGSTSDASAGDGSVIPSTSKLNYPVGIALDQDNNYLYIADKLNHKIKRLNMNTNIVDTLVGNGTSGDVDGSITFARLSFPHDLFVMNNPGSSTVFVTDSGNNKIKILEVNDTGSVRHIRNMSGTTISGDKNGLSHEAQFNYPIGIVMDSSGSVLIADTNNHKIRKMTKQ